MQWTIVIFTIFSIIYSGITENGMEGSAKVSIDEMETHNKTPSSPSNTIKQQVQTASPLSQTLSEKPHCSDIVSSKDKNICPSNAVCATLGGECLECDFNCTCVYGETINVTCTALDGVECSGVKAFQRVMICRYCYQTEVWEHSCSGNDQCLPVSTPRDLYRSNCTVKSEIVCLGNRLFPKMLPCNWTSGYNWVTALILSITLGGFGADRFYLGHWQEGIGKLFSFGGLGVWTIMDVILIAIRYLGPEDGSLYI